MKTRIVKERICRRGSFSQAVEPFGIGIIFYPLLSKEDYRDRD
jgi:hypothetical protein